MPRSKANESTTIKKRKKHERGKASEYRNLDPFATMDPEREQTKYTKELLTGHGLAKHARNFIKEKWWRDFCTSANEPRFYGCLFENYMFDEDGMLEWGYPGYEKVVQCLAMGYMHIIRAFGEENLNGWKVQWGMNIEYGPFIQLFNDEMQEQFGLTQPKSGFYDHSSKLSTLRTQRGVGKDLEVLEHNMMSYQANKEDKKEGDMDTSRANMSAVVDFDIISKIDDWRADADVDNDFKEAKERLPNNNLNYVYKTKDSNSVRKAWLW